MWGGIELSRNEVIEYIDDFLHDRGKNFDWDDFVCIPIKNNSELEAIRVRCRGLRDEFPLKPGEAGYCNDSGIGVLRQISWSCDRTTGKEPWHRAHQHLPC